MTTWLLNVRVYSHYADCPEFRLATGIDSPYWHGELEVIAGITPEDVNEELFRIFNIDHPSTYKLPSLSVGDRVMWCPIGEESMLEFEVMHTGFKQLVS
jgi:hypothetical protein